MKRSGIVQGALRNQRTRFNPQTSFVLLTFLTTPHIIAFPGWGCTLEPKTWFGHTIQCYSHLTQMRAFINEIPMQSIIPQEDWILVTWSMGSWMGLELSKIWKNPPKHWLALSPFLTFLGEGTRINEASFERLLKAFDEDPKRTMQFFEQKQGGGFKNWCVSEGFRDVDWVLLKKTLHYLGHHPPIMNDSFDIPNTCLIGDKDRLVSTEMTHRFGQYFKHSKTHILEGATHALFYEEPETVKTFFLELIEQT